MKERPVLPSSESFTTRQDLQGKFALQEDQRNNFRILMYLSVRGICLEDREELL